MLKVLKVSRVQSNLTRIQYIKILFFLFAISWHFLVYALPISTLHYDVVFKDVNLVQAIFDLSKLDDTYYLYTFDASATGFFSWFKKYHINAKSRFTINNAGVSALNYQMIKTIGSKKKKAHLLMDMKNQLVLNKIKKTTQRTKYGNIVDNLSLFMALTYDVSKYPNQKQYTYQVASLSGVKEKIFINEGLKIINLNNAEQIEAIKISHFKKSDNYSKIWLGVKQKHLPVYIQNKEDGELYTYILKRAIIRE